MGVRGVEGDAVVSSVDVLEDRLCCLVDFPELEVKRELRGKNVMRVDGGVEGEGSKGEFALKEMCKFLREVGVPNFLDLVETGVVGV
jgi:hypothetical protein